MQGSLLTVIVPVYKVEKYLHRCVDSIINQTYRNLEIILVDDGSPDNCPAICDEYAKKDNRIKVIHQENKGLSGARNAGLDVATGDYIAFVDSDDWIELDAYERVMNVIIYEKLDVVGFNFWYEYGDRSVVGRNTPCNYINRLMIDDVGSYVWVYVFSKEVFQILNLRFPVGQKFEDFVMMSDIFDNIRNYTILDCCFYHYSQINSNSICRTTDLLMQQYAMFLGYIRRIDFGKRHNNIWVERHCAVRAYRIGIYLYLKNLIVKKFTGGQLCEIKNFLKDFHYSAKWYLLRPQDMVACWCIFHYQRVLYPYAKWKFSRHD